MMSPKVSPGKKKIFLLPYAAKDKDRCIFKASDGCKAQIADYLLQVHFLRHFHVSNIKSVIYGFSRISWPMVEVGVRP